MTTSCKEELIMSNRRWPTLLLALAGALALGVVLVACGGGGGGGKKTPSPTKAATAAKTATKAATEAMTAEATATKAIAPEATATKAPSTSKTTLDVAEKEFTITPSITTVPAGNITFNVRNTGTVAHDFLVIKTELDPAALPYDQAAYKVIESQVDVLKHQHDIPVGGSATVTLDLTAGHYVLICNVPSHYESRMRIAFTVR